MANKQDILTTIKNLDHFLKIPELKGAKPRLNANGSPFTYVGGFNMVFQLLHNTKNWAFRVWHVPMGKNKDRYISISKYLKSLNLPYFADFIYDQNGVLLNGVLIDTIRMEWLDGILLKDYIEKHLSDKIKLEKLANDFIEMTKTLRKNNISHGDLQEGNILVDDAGKIRLVDYDSICIPEIEGQADIVTGLKGYQHPSRFKNGKASLKADYFSELIIYLSILGISSRPRLWNKYQVKDTQYLLFTETDFENIESTRIYSDLKGASPLIDSLLLVLKRYLQTSNYLNLEPFAESLLPTEKSEFEIPREVAFEEATSILELMDLIKGDNPVLIEFYVSSWKLCQAYQPALKEVLEKFNGRVKMKRVEVKQISEATKIFHLTRVPTLILFKREKQIWIKTGLLSPGFIIRSITKYLD